MTSFSVSPRFGWTVVSQQEILDATPKLVQDSGLRGFIQQSLPRIKQDNRDFNAHKAGQHATRKLPWQVDYALLEETQPFQAHEIKFVSLKGAPCYHPEATLKPENATLKPYSKIGERVLAAVKGPKQEKKTGADHEAATEAGAEQPKIDFKQVALELLKADPAKNLVSQIAASYQQLVTSFQVGDATQIAQSIGALTDSSSRIFEPPCLSMANHWPLSYAKNSHVGKEFRASNPPDKVYSSFYVFETFAEGKISSTPPAFETQSQSWKGPFPKLLKEGYLKFLNLYKVAGPLVSGHRLSRDKRDFKDFKEQAEPIAEEQINKAPGYLAWLIERAFEEAGRPPLPAAAPESEASSSTP